MTESIESRIHKEFLRMMKEMPLEQIQVKRLCTRSGISRSTFYVNYESVYDVLQDIEDTLIAELLGAKQERGRSNQMDIREDIHQTLLHSMKNLDVLQALMGRYGDGSFKARWARTITRTIRNSGLLESGDSEEWERCITTFLVGGTQQMITNWILHPEGISMDTVENVIYRCVTQVFPLLKE